MRPTSFVASFLAISIFLTLPACTESPSEQRTRLEKFIADNEGLSQEQITDRLQELDAEDREVLSEILTQQIAETQAQLDGNSGLTGRLIRYASEDQGRADRIVADCEADIGVSASGPDARLIAECVDQRW